jgi:hypothetical protein
VKTIRAQARNKAYADLLSDVNPAVNVSATGRLLVDDRGIDFGFFGATAGTDWSALPVKAATKFRLTNTGATAIQIRRPRSLLRTEGFEKTDPFTYDLGTVSSASAVSPISGTRSQRIGFAGDSSGYLKLGYPYMSRISLTFRLEDITSTMRIGLYATQNLIDTNHSALSLYTTGNISGSTSFGFRSGSTLHPSTLAAGSEGDMYRVDFDLVGSSPLVTVSEYPSGSSDYHTFGVGNGNDGLLDECRINGLENCYIAVQGDGVAAIVVDSLDYYGSFNADYETVQSGVTREYPCQSSMSEYEIKSTGSDSDVDGLYSS